MALSIVKAEYIKDYKIKLFFSDGKENTIDFEPFLNSSRNPMTGNYLNLDVFKKFKIEFGDLIWNDYELCFPIIDLYEDNIIKCPARHVA